MPHAVVAAEVHIKFARTMQKGFSLIELIVVICIVVLVLWQLLPRVEKNLVQAHETAVSLGARALRDGIERSQAIRMLDGLSGRTYNLPRFGDDKLDLSPGGFPAGTSRKPGDKLSAQHCEEIWNALLDSNGAEIGKSTEPNYRFTLALSGKNAICVYSYVHGGNMSISYDPATGKVWADARFKGSAFAD